MKEEKLSWTTERRKVDDLVPLKINPRKISKKERDQLLKSLEKFNLVGIPVVNLDGTIISGHQRITALQMLGRGSDLIDVRIPNRYLSEKEVKEYNLTANTHSGEFDFDILRDNFFDVNLDDFGIVVPDVFSGQSRESEKVEIKPYKATHILLSFPPESMIKIQGFIEEIRKFPKVEYDQSSN